MQAQHPPEEWCDFEPPVIEPKLNYAFAPTGPIRVPVVFHVYHNDAGIGNHALADLQTQIDTMNVALTGSDITLFLRGVHRVEDNSVFYHHGAHLAAAKAAHHVVPGRVSEGVLEAGAHRFELSASGLPAGVYLVRSESGERSLSRRITLLK